MSETVAVVTAAGSGERLGAGIPKAFVDLGGLTMLERAVDGLLASGVVDRVVVAAPADRVDETAVLLAGRAVVVEGGPQRDDSVRCALDAVGDPEFVVVHDAAVAVDEPTGRATKEIKRSDAVVFVDPEGVAARRRAIAAAEELAAKPEGTLVLSLELADPIAVQGSILDMNWGGEMKVTRDARGGRAEGALASRSGWFELLENRFTLESGQVTFPEDGLDPYLDVTAIAEVDSVRVTAQVYGRASAPIIELRSEPTLDPYQIVGLLITGSAELSESDDAEIQAKAAGLLANFSSPGLRRRLRERTGIDRVGVGFGDDVTQPIVSAGKRLTRKLESEARYHHNAPPGENNVQLGFGYHFAPRWTLETFFGDAAKGGVDVFWRHSFGAPNASNARENAARQRAPGRARREKTDEDAPRRGAAATQR